jgi:hypothetical protein
LHFRRTRISRMNTIFSNDTRFFLFVQRHWIPPQISSLALSMFRSFMIRSNNHKLQQMAYLRPKDQTPGEATNVAREPETVPPRKPRGHRESAPRMTNRVHYSTYGYRVPDFHEKQTDPSHDPPHGPRVAPEKISRQGKLLRFETGPRVVRRGFCPPVLNGGALCPF